MAWMVSPLKAAALGLAAGLAFGAGGAVLAWRDGHQRAVDVAATDMATYKTTVLEGQRLAVQAALQRLAQASARADALSRQLQDTEAAAAAHSKETADEIRHLTQGRACLDARTVRVLNRTAPAARPGAAPVPAAPGQPDPADGTFATDTDIALWADSARTQYDTCRARLDALIDWHPQPASAPRVETP